MKLPKNSDWKTLATLGVIKGENLSYLKDRNGYYCYAQVPEGWFIEGTNHSLCSVLKNGFGDQLAFIRYADPIGGYASAPSLEICSSVYNRIWEQKQKLQSEAQNRKSGIRNLWTLFTEIVGI
jgi:hypothetical protein